MFRFIQRGDLEIFESDDFGNKTSERSYFLVIAIFWHEKFKSCINILEASG